MADLLVNTHVRFHIGDEVTLQQVAHGLHPLVLIQVDVDNDTMVLDIDSTGPWESTEDLADLLESMVVFALRNSTMESGSDD